jgi:hypothetical protein
MLYSFKALRPRTDNTECPAQATKFKNSCPWIAFTVLETPIDFERHVIHQIIRLQSSSTDVLARLVISPQLWCFQHLGFELPQLVLSTHPR